MAKVISAFVGFIALSVFGYILAFWLSTRETVKDVSVSTALHRQRQLALNAFMEKYSKLHKKRLLSIKGMCKKKRKNITHMKRHPIFLVNEEHKVIYCQTPKVGTVSWCRIFLVLSGYKNYSEVIKMTAESVAAAWKIHVPRLSNYIPKKQEEIMRSYTKIMFVRNPLTRLLSAFNDKLIPKNESDYRLSYQRSLSEQILKKFRAGNNSGRYDPTFSEFIRMVASVDDSIENIHWRNMHEICFPCDINYTMIGRFEDIENDSNYILRYIGSNLTFPKSTGYHFTNSSNFEKLQQIYATIPYTDLKSIYRKYQYDFTLFNYKKLIPLHT